MRAQDIGKGKKALIYTLRLGSALVGVKLWEEDEDVFTLRQVHSDWVVFADGENKELEGDAIITDRVGLKIGVRTADCVPIVFVGREKVAVVHAGWRGLHKGIIEKTVKLMEEEPIYAFVGPSAKACCYKVGEDFKQIFTSILYRSGGFYMDTSDEALLRLKRLRVRSVVRWNSCTVCNTALPSHRRDRTNIRLLTFVEKLT